MIMVEVQKVMILLGFLTMEASAEKLVQKHQSLREIEADSMGHNVTQKQRMGVYANGSVYIAGHFVDSTRKQSPSLFRKQSMVVHADGNIESADQVFDSTRKPSPGQVWKQLTSATMAAGTKSLVGRRQDSLQVLAAGEVPAPAVISRVAIACAVTFCILLAISVRWWLRQHSETQRLIQSSQEPHLSSPICAHSTQGSAVTNKIYSKPNTIGLLTSFLSAAREDGYITSENYDTLKGAIDDICEGAASKVDVPMRRALCDAKAEMMLPALGFSNARDVKREAAFWNALGPKIRGSVEDQTFADPMVAKVLESGIDCEAILHDDTFNCRARGNIQEDVPVIAYGFMQPFNYLGYYQMDGRKLSTWLQEIGKQYIDAPYHNWRHAFDVFQLSFLTLTDGGMTRYFNHQDCFCLMIAAIAHDVGHEGTNNVFHVKAHTGLAKMYNDKSPLENMHASLAFETLSCPGANFFERLPIEDFANSRAKIIDAILETDPSRHFAFVEKLSARIKKGMILAQDEIPLDDSAGKKADVDDRRLLLQGFVHLWDIGNGFRPWNVYKHLVASLEEEFFAQGDKEKELGIPVTMMMDRAEDRLVGGQGYFLVELVLPLFDLYAKMLKDDIVAGLKNNLESNKMHWQTLIDKFGQKTIQEILALENS